MQAIAERALVAQTDSTPPRSGPIRRVRAPYPRDWYCCRALIGGIAGRGNCGLQWRAVEHAVPEQAVPEQATLPVATSESRRVSLDAPIEAKLHAPAARREWVEREELVGYLAGVTARLVLVDAPAGFGKTTLVAQWRSSPA